MADKRSYDNQDKDSICISMLTELPTVSVSRWPFYGRAMTKHFPRPAFYSYSFYILIYVHYFIATFISNKID